MDYLGCQERKSTGLGEIIMPPLLRKPLEKFFDDRVLEKTQETSDAFKSQNLYYTISAEQTVARGEISCLNAKLVDARHAWRKDKLSHAERWKAANEKNERIFSNLPEFNGYFKDLFVRRERANKATISRNEKTKEKEKEIRMKKKEVERLYELLDGINERLDKFDIFKTYLERVLLESKGEYESLKDVIDRFGVLANARDNLMAQNDNFRETVTRKQKSLERDIVMKSNEVLAYRNYLSELMEYDTILRERVFRLDDSLLRIKTTAAQRTLIIGQIKMAIYNLYLSISKSLHRPARLEPEDTIGQLFDVRLSLKEMGQLSHDIKRMLKLAHLTAKAEEALKKKLERIQEERKKKIERLTKAQTVDVRRIFNLPPLKIPLPTKLAGRKSILDKATGTTSDSEGEGDGRGFTTSSTTRGNWKKNENSIFAKRSKSKGSANSTKDLAPRTKSMEHLAKLERLSQKSLDKHMKQSFGGVAFQRTNLSKAKSITTKAATGHEHRRNSAY